MLSLKQKKKGKKDQLSLNIKKKIQIFIGLTFGGIWGLMEGLRGHTPNFKLRLNTVLNSVTRRGPFIGNSCGVLGNTIFYIAFIIYANYKRLILFYFSVSFGL